jgi:hypothetical protein
VVNDAVRDATAIVLARVRGDRAAELEIVARTDDAAATVEAVVDLAAGAVAALATVDLTVDLTAEGLDAGSVVALDRAEQIMRRLALRAAADDEPGTTSP